MPAAPRSDPINQILNGCNERVKAPKFPDSVVWSWSVDKQSWMSEAELATSYQWARHKYQGGRYTPEFNTPMDN